MNLLTKITEIYKLQIKESNAINKKYPNLKGLSQNAINRKLAPYKNIDTEKKINSIQEKYFSNSQDILTALDYVVDKENLFSQLIKKIYHIDKNTLFRFFLNNYTDRLKRPKIISQITKINESSQTYINLLATTSHNYSSSFHLSQKEILIYFCENNNKIALDFSLKLLTSQKSDFDYNISDYLNNYESDIFLALIKKLWKQLTPKKKSIYFTQCINTYSQSDFELFLNHIKFNPNNTEMVQLISNEKIENTTNLEYIYANFLSTRFNFFINKINNDKIKSYLNKIHLDKILIKNNTIQKKSPHKL